jgi:plasmid stabilization system protein ParE
MSKKGDVEVVWTRQSLRNARNIQGYLAENFSEREIASFYKHLEIFEVAVSKFSKLYPLTSKKTMVRRAVLSKVLSVFYRYKGQKAEVLAIFDNRCDLSDWI